MAEELIEEGSGIDLPPPPPKKKEGDAVDLPPPPKKKTEDSTSTELNSSGTPSGSKAQSTSKKSAAPKKTDEPSLGFDFAKFKETFPEKNPKVKVNVPEEEVLANQQKQKKELLKSPAVKKADENIKKLDTDITDISRTWNQIKADQKINIESLQRLSDRINDPTTPEDVRQLLIPTYNHTLESAKTTEQTEKQVRDKAIALQRSKATLKKVYQVQEDLDQDLNDDALKVTGNFLTHVYNATLPSIISGAGSLIEATGDVVDPTNNIPGMENNKKLTDIIGEGLQHAGHMARGETDERYDDKHYITSTAGDIVGSVVSAAIPGGAVAKAGKAAQMIMGATTATMEMADGVYQKAGEAGLSDRDAGLMTLTIAPISGLLEVWGAGNIIDNVAGKKIINELISESTKKLAGQTITKELMYETVGQTFKEVGQKYGLNALKSAGEEGGTELLQAEVEKAAENIYDKTQEKDSYGTKFFSVKEQLDVAKQAAIGAVAGGSLGILSGISKPQNIYEKAVQLKEDPDKLAKFGEMLETEVKAGHIDAEQAENIKANINAMLDADEKIPDTITDKDKRFQAVELIKEKTALEEEIKGMDKALTTEKRDRIKEINSELEVIATGKERVKMPRKDITPKTEKAAPAAEETVKVEETIKAVPLTAEEKTELGELERDNKRIGLEGEELTRYQELKAKVVPDVQTEIKFDGKQTKAEFISEQKAKLREEDALNEQMDNDGVYGKIFGNKYELAQLREERSEEMQQNEEKDVQPSIKEEEYAGLATELDQEPELGEINSRAETIVSEAEGTGELVRAASDEGKALPEAEIDRLETEQKELLKDIDHVITTPSRNKKKASRITKILSEKPSSIREAALHYYLGDGQIRKADAERIMGSNFSKADWGKNSTLFDDKATSIDKVAKEKFAELMGREITPDEEIQIGEELADIALNKSNKNDLLSEAKTYREQKGAEKDFQEMNAHLSSGSNEKVVSFKSKVKKSSSVQDDIGYTFTDKNLDKIQKEKLAPIEVNVEKDNFNRLHISGIAHPLLNKGYGKEIYNDLLEKYGYISTSDGSSSDDVQRVWDSLKKTSPYWARVDGKLIVSKEKAIIEKFIQKKSDLSKEPDIESSYSSDDIVMKQEGDKDTDLPFQKILKSDKYTGSQKRVVKSVTNVVKALSKIAPGLKVVVHETDESFEQAAYEANIKLGLSEKQAKKNLAGRAFYFGKGDHTIHLNLPKVKSNTLFHEGTHPILNVVEELRPGSIDAMFNELAKIEKAIGEEGKYTEDFASYYGEDQKKMEAITEFIADVAAGKVEVTESNFSKIKRLFAKLLRAFGIDVKSITEENIISLAKKIQQGFEKGEAIDIETNRSLRDALQFQEPSNTDNISQEDIEWALKTFKKLGNDFEVFREKLSKTEEGRDLLSKNLFGAMLEHNSSKPQASTSDRLKALSDSLHKADYISKELKEKIDENGLRAEVFSHEEARQIADRAIKLLGIDGAVDLANKRLKGSVKAFVYGAAIDHYATAEAAATNPEEKDALAQKGADIAEQFQKDAEDYGRFISAIGEFYKNSPLIIKKTETNKLRTQAKKALEGMRNTLNKVKSAKRELDTTAKRDIKEAKEGTPRKKLASAQVRTTRAKELMDKWNSIKGGVQKQVTGYTQEQTDILVEMGAIHIADGAWTFKDWYKKMKEDFGVSEGAAREVWEKEKMPSDLDAEQRTLSQMLQEDVVPSDDYKNKQEAILNKYFPKKKTESASKQKDDHDKILEQYNAGVFGAGKNKDEQDFESLFYEKLGIVNPDSPEVQSKIGEFAEKIAKAPEGSIMQREAQEDLLTYIAKIAYRTKLAAGASKLSSIWYANILSSPATHLRNIQYNTITSAISQPFLLMEKALINKDPRAVGAHLSGFLDGLKKGIVEAGRVMRTGRSSRFDNVSAQPELERGGKIIKKFSLPGRALKASDIFFTDAAYNLKLADLARQLVLKEHSDYTPEQVTAATNELLGNTKERKEAAQKQAEKEMADFYGEDWKSQKGASAIFKIRQFEIMDSFIPEDIKEEAKKWSKKALLTSRPTGVLGVVADGINHWNEKLYFTKFVIPFVNVPFNLVNAIIDRSPLGLVTAIRKAEGFGSFKEQLSNDEVKELYIKIANYAAATTLLALMNGDDDDDPLVITGAQTGDYMDNKGIIRGGGLEPYSVYMYGKKIMSYKTSPWAAALLVPGYIRDAKLYQKSSDATDVAAYSALNWMLFINDQSAMQGVQGLVSTVAEAKKTNSETITTTIAKYGQNMILPYSGALKFFNNNMKALMGENDYRPIDPWEYVTKDVPFLDQVARTRKDHFGQDVKEQFDIPMVPAGHRGLLKEMAETSPYYEMCKEKGYYPTFSTQRKMYVEGSEINISKKELDDINTDRGQIVKSALDSKNVFVPKDEADVDETLAEMTTMDYLKTLDKAEFKKRMDDLFTEATKLARIRKYGSKVGITAKDVDKASEDAELMGSEPEYSKEEANKNLEEQFREGGNIQIAIDAY